MEATLNVRLDAALKARGNAVLEAAGLGASDIVRALWEEMAVTQKVPEFSAHQVKEDEEERQIRAEIMAFATHPRTKYSTMTDEELREGYYAQFA